MAALLCGPAPHPFTPCTVLPEGRRERTGVVGEVVLGEQVDEDGAASPRRQPRSHRGVPRHARHDLSSSVPGHQLVREPLTSGGQMPVEQLGYYRLELAEGGCRHLRQITPRSPPVRDGVPMAGKVITAGKLALMATELPELLVLDHAEWRAWLDKNHAGTPGVWLVLAKKTTTTPTTLTYGQALEEAVCYGWVDGQVGRRDELTYRQRFTPRRYKSAWSAGNVALAERLITRARMTPAGLAAVERAKADGTWKAPRERLRDQDR